MGEAFNRLDFSSAIQDIRRFNYVVRVSIHFTATGGHVEWLRPKDYHVTCLRCFWRPRKLWLFLVENHGMGVGSGGGGSGALQPTSRVTLETEGEAGVSLRVSCPIGFICIFYFVFFPEQEPCSMGSKVVEEKRIDTEQSCRSLIVLMIHF